MFETVVPEKFAKKSRKALYEALPLSLAFHALVGAGVIAVNIWEITFPDQSPAQVVAFSLADTPPPPPPPPPPPKAVPQQAQVKRVVPQEIVAPTVIPDTIPEVLPEPVVVATSEEGVVGGVEGGVEGGEVGGVVGGVLASVIIPEVKQEAPDRVTIERDKPLPLFPLSQVYPAYPEDARVRSWEDQLVVRYLIGKDGRVKEVSVVSPPERDAFVKPTLKAIRSWRFKPMVKNGERQEVVHELTVFYRLSQQS